MPKTSCTSSRSIRRWRIAFRPASSTASAGCSSGCRRRRSKSPASCSADAVEKLARENHPPIVLVSPQIRAGLKQLTASHLPRLVVLSYNEITRDTQIESVAMVTDRSNRHQLVNTFQHGHSNLPRRIRFTRPEMVREELGPDAVVLRTREVRTGGLIGTDSRRSVLGIDRIGRCAVHCSHGCDHRRTGSGNRFDRTGCRFEFDRRETQKFIRQMNRPDYEYDQRIRSPKRFRTNCGGRIRKPEVETRWPIIRKTVNTQFAVKL